MGRLGRAALWSDQGTHTMHQLASWIWALQDLQHLQSLWPCAMALLGTVVSSQISS